MLKIGATSKGLSPMVQSLGKVMFQAKLERGCVDCQLYSEIGKSQCLLYVEQWATPEAFESQLRSQRFGMLLAIMETAPQAPDLEVRTVSEQRGLEYVRSIRLASPGIASAAGRDAVPANDHPSQPTGPASISP